MGSIKNIFSNINVVLESLNGILQSTYGLFPKNMLYIFLIVILVYSLIFMRKNKCNITLNLLTIILICIGTAIWTKFIYFICIWNRQDGIFDRRNDWINAFIHIL